MTSQEVIDAMDAPLRVVMGERARRFKWVKRKDGMPRIELVTEINAAPDRCFDLARDLDLHVQSMSHTREMAVGGKTTGLIGMGEEVTWRGRHFGIVHHHTSRITAFDRPRHFRDEMTRGRFKSFCHDHYFESVGGGTRMVDVVDFVSPLGIVGTWVDRLILTRYLERLLQIRNAVVQMAAESGVQSKGADETTAHCRSGPGTEGP